MKNIQEGFVNIQTLFDENTERTVEALQKLYDDHTLLLAVIEKLSGNVLTEEKLKGKKILLKPNWVKQNYKPFDEICLRTHNSFSLAVLEFVLSKKPSAVVIGDAPIQGCFWEKAITTDLTDKINALSQRFDIPVKIKDFRRVVFDGGGNKIEVERNPMSEYVIFDVGKKSYLEPVTSKDKNLFRVSQYNADRFIATHKPGMHKYCITKEILDADVVISLPKIKTHQKTGITCALKNLVGINGDKDFLPHHRIGGTGMGGDSYPGKNWLRYAAELALDNANRNKGKKLYLFWTRLSSLLWKLSRPTLQHQHSAAWFGNDTTWRMVMDLNMVANYGKADGTLADMPNRFLYSFCDGIIGGQGDGPLLPDPLNLGVLCFSNDSANTDICMAKMMGLKIDHIPLLMAAKSFMPNRKTTVSLNGEIININELDKFATPAIPPPGWLDYATAAKTISG